MFSPLDFLKKYFPVKILDNLKKGKLSIAPKILSENKLYNVEGNTINLNYSPTYIVTSQKIISKIFNADCGFISLNRNASLSVIKEYKNSISGDDDVEYFRGKISEEDFIVISISRFIAKLYKENKRLEGDLRRNELQQKYGQRGLNIYNLYSSGYYTNSFKPLYELLSESGYPIFIYDFNEVLSIYVDNPAITLFVSSSKSYEQVKKSFGELIERNISYGIYHVNIHAINTLNVNKVKRLITDYKEKIEKTETKENGDSIMSRIFLKSNGNNCLPRRREVGMLAGLST